MNRVIGIGGIFFKAEQPERLLAWYEKHLGIKMGPGFPGTIFDAGTGQTVWSVFPSDTGYFNPSSAPFMINYRVENLRALLDVLKQEGVEVDDKIEESEFGVFGWVIDPEGNRVELWEAPKE